MARAKKKTKARAKPKSKPRAKAASTAQKSAAKGTRKKAGTEVERRWKEYWRIRKELEDVVAKVRSAKEALDAAMDLERTKREDFDETRRILTQLLDVEPAGPRLLPENVED